MRTEGGNLLWDVPGFVDEAAVRAVRELGGVAAVMASHPHMYGCQLEWAWADGAGGRGVLLSGGTCGTVSDQGWVTFMRSYPNCIPLSSAVVTRVAGTIGELEFDRLYDNFGGQVATGARSAVLRSAQRYVEWVRGDHDHLT